MRVAACLSANAMKPAVPPVPGLDARRRKPTRRPRRDRQRFFRLPTDKLLTGHIAPAAKFGYHLAVKPGGDARSPSPATIFHSTTFRTFIDHGHHPFPFRILSRPA